VLNSRTPSFHGQLSEFRLVELIQTMGLNGSSGALHLVHRDGRKGVIYFEDGAPVYCRGSDGDALTLGDVLKQLGKVDDQAITESYDSQVHDPLGDPLGQRLVEREAITSHDLEEALRTQLLWNVREMSLWDDGECWLTPGELPPPRVATQPIEASQITMEIIRYQHEWTDLIQWLPGGMHTRLRMATMPPPNHPLIFTAAVWSILSHVNAFQTPRRIATALYRPEQQIARELPPLLRDTLIYASSAQRLPSGPVLAGTIRSETVDLFGLLSRMEQEWLRCKPIDRLTAMAKFIDWTMDALESAWRANNLGEIADSLEALLQREQCREVAGHPLRVTRNRIDVDDFAAYLRAAAQQRRPIDVRAAFHALAGGLEAVFRAINGRVDNVQDRTYYEDAWNSALAEFSQTLFRPGASA
jgi:hypothetical protein